MRLPIKRLDPGLPLPAYAHEGDAGLDLFSADDVTLAPLQRALVPTGVAIAIPEGHAGFIQPRSGLALREGLGFVNAPGLIDSHYRGELKVVAINMDPERTLRLRRGDRIAQLVVQPVVRVEPVDMNELEPTARGEAGFGSSGQ